ncbi:glycosyltransferase [Streptococcus didelphis]|uniref:glycosyltransferase n=1 Tax=Streptococcus didelphis TaxID=102886 RepID=UPI0027D2CA9E|nr:glycosyltransferase [Streptococcus didelphis]WMB30176.1 glycosyltransferase [Streptococcus didelphis]
MKKAIDSVLNQTYKNIELIVVNDCPNYIENDLIQELILNYQSRVRYIINNGPHGANYARNIGVMKTKGTFISFLDDDDYWDKSRIELFSKFFDNKPVLIYSDIIMFNEKGSKISKRKYPIKEKQLETLLYDNFLGGFSNVMINKNALLNSGGLNENMKSYQDQELWLRILPLGEIIYINKPLTYYRISDESISNNNTNKVQGLNSLLKIHKKYYEKYPESKIKKLRNEYILALKNGWNENSIIIRKYLEQLVSLKLLFLWTIIGTSKKSL